MPYVISAIFSPILGWYIDNYGKRMTISLTGAFFMVLAHLVSILAPDSCTWDEGCSYSIVP